MVENYEYKNEKEDVLLLRLRNENGGYTEFGKIMKEFPVQKENNFAEYKAKNMVLLVNKFYEKTKEKLCGFFTVDEAWAISETFNPYLYTVHDDDKEALENNVRDSFEYEGYEEWCEADKDELMGKIATLNEWESFTVIRMAIEFWSRKTLNIDGEQLLKEIFGIA